MLLAFRQPLPTQKGQGRGISVLFAGQCLCIPLEELFRLPRGSLYQFWLSHVADVAAKASHHRIKASR
jgi:hypothetical protein